MISKRPITNLSKVRTYSAQPRVQSWRHKFTNTFGRGERLKWAKSRTMIYSKRISSFITRTFYHVKCTNVWVSQKSLMDSPMVYGVTKCSYLNKYLKINKLIHLSWIVKIGVENVYSNNILLCFTVSHHTRVGGERDYNNNNTLLHLYLSHHTSPRCYDMISTRIFNV